MSGWDERRARMALGCVVDGGDPVVASLVDQLGAQGAWTQVGLGVLGEMTARRAAHVDVAVADRLATAAGARFVIPGDDEWPEQLEDLRQIDPIQRRGGVPYGLWLRGPGHLRDWLGRSVAVVGARAATAYGKEEAHALGQGLAASGVTVVSGCAFGVDAAAHQGALAAEGRTIGVLANGVDVAYPPGNAALVDALARDHLLVSELPPGSHPTRVRFLARNRLIAAMAQGTVVVEAAVRSGARNTAGWALECQRPVMAMPGPVYSRMSAGPHLLIRNGQATLVTGADDVREMVSAVGEAMVPMATGPRRAVDDLKPDELAVYEALPARRRISVGDVALTAGVSVPSCLSALALLESRGLAEADDRGWTTAAVR